MSSQESERLPEPDCTDLGEEGSDEDEENVVDEQNRQEQSAGLQNTDN